MAVKKSFGSDGVPEVVAASSIGISNFVFLAGGGFALSFALLDALALPIFLFDYHNNFKQKTIVFFKILRADSSAV